MRGLGKWAQAVAKGSRPKTRGKRSRRKSLLSKKESMSSSGESAAVHSAQTRLVDFGDEIKMCDNDPAVEKTVENLSDVGSDAPTKGQEKEAPSIGGIVSQWY